MHFEVDPFGVSFNGVALVHELIYRDGPNGFAGPISLGLIWNSSIEDYKVVGPLIMYRQHKFMKFTRNNISSLVTKSPFRQSACMLSIVDWDKATLVYSIGRRGLWGGPTCSPIIGLLVVELGDVG